MADSILGLVRDVKLRKKSKAGDPYTCYACDAPIIAGMKFFRWFQGGTIVRQCEKHGEPKNYELIRPYKFEMANTRVSAGFTHEKNDCTVRALQHSTGISYEEAHTFMKKHGREDGKGAMSNFIYPKFAMNGKKLTHSGFLGECIDKKGGYRKRYRFPTINQMIQKLGKGSYILNINRHVIALVDGIVKDSHISGGKSRVKSYFTVVEG